MNSQSQNQSSPSTEAIIAAYQVASAAQSQEGNFIWQRTQVFLALNTIVVAGLTFMPQLPKGVLIVLPFLGVAFTASWHMSMRRAWEYFGYYIAIMREQEEALGLQNLGWASRGRKILRSKEKSIVAGDMISFTPMLAICKARALNSSITFLFLLGYIGLAIKSLVTL